MKKGTALGFWAKNPLIMDKLYDLGDLEESLKIRNGLPLDLVSLIKENKALLDDLIKLAEREEREASKKLDEKLRKILEVAGATIPQKKCGLWNHQIMVKTSDGRQTRARLLQLGWEWRTEAEWASLGNQAMYLDTWVWTKGGRESEKMLLNQIKKFNVPALGTMTAASDISKNSWQSGVVRLNRINVSERVYDDFSLDLDVLFDDVWKSFAWITKLRLAKLFRLQYNPYKIDSIDKK